MSNTKTILVNKIDISIEREKVREKVNLSIEKWKRLVKNHRILSLKARIALAEIDMRCSCSSATSRAVAAADKAEAEMILAKIEVEDAKEELSQYPEPTIDYDKLFPNVKSHEIQH